MTSLIFQPFSITLIAISIAAIWLIFFKMHKKNYQYSVAISFASLLDVTGTRRKAPAFRHGDIRRKLAVDAKPQKV